MKPDYNKIYDFVIIGSGFGGLLSAHILASEGHSVVVLEKNHQIGGNLQVFSRDKVIFDTGVHYIGSLDEGQCLNQYFKYFGLMDLPWKRLDEECFDLVRLSDGSEFKYGHGYDNFKENLLESFPKEEKAIDTFINKLKEVASQFPLYNLDSETEENFLESTDLLELNAYDYIKSITDDVTLQMVLGGTNILYAGVKEKSPFYVHALIIDSYLHGSYRLIKGGSQIAKRLSKGIRSMGGQILKHHEVLGAEYNENKEISAVVLKDGNKIKGKTFISNAHPQATLNIFGEKNFKPVYANRIKSLENTCPPFSVHIVLKENSFKYFNYNLHISYDEDVWNNYDYDDESWPRNCFVSSPASKEDQEFAESLSVMCYMNFEDVQKWEESFNTISEPGERKQAYYDFKREKEDKVIQKLEEKFPDIRSHIKSIYSSTPLTNRDYIGDFTGSTYGVLKNSQSPFKSFVDNRTRIKNLYLTGQNTILHGIMGTAIGALRTCFNFVDKKELMNKILSAK